MNGLGLREHERVNLAGSLDRREPLDPRRIRTRGIRDPHAVDRFSQLYFDIVFYPVDTAIAGRKRAREKAKAEAERIRKEEEDRKEEEKKGSSRGVFIFLILLVLGVLGGIVWLKGEVETSQAQLD